MIFSLLTSTTSASRRARRSSGSSRSGLSPGLLQTREYARVVTAVGSVDPKEVDKFVEIRLRRQQEMAQRENKPQQYFVIDEAVIRRHVGIKTSRAIMPAQLRSIADRAERDDRLTVRVIPFASGAHPGMFDTFTLLEFDGQLPDVLYLEAAREDTTWSPNDPLAARYAEDSNSCWSMPCLRKDLLNSSGTLRRKCYETMFSRTPRQLQPYR